MPAGILDISASSDGDRPDMELEEYAWPDTLKAMLKDMKHVTEATANPTVN